jgi:hypothetical protein
MTDKGSPGWAIRLREERIRRLWSQKVAAVRLRDAADEETRAVLPAVESIQRYVRDYEAGKHFPGDLYAELYCRAFGLTYGILFGTPPGTRTRVTHPDRLPAKDDARSLASWITATNISDNAIDDIAQAISALSEAHTQRAPAGLLTDVVRIHQQVHGLLRGGKQRLRQARALYRLDADLLAHASLLYALTVATQSGDPDSALRAAEIADAAWAGGAPRVVGVWAQVWLGAGIARIMKGDLDGAQQELMPVLGLAPKFRIATITGYTASMDKRLQQRLFRNNALAAQMRRQVREFNSGALPALRVISEDV